MTAFNPTALQALLVLTASAFDRDSLERAATDLLAWGLGGLHMVDITWGDRLGYSPSHRLVPLPPPAEAQTSLHLARHALRAWEFDEAKIQLTDVLIQIGFATPEKARIEAEIALNEARNHSKSELLCQTLWKVVHEHLQAVSERRRKAEILSAAVETLCSDDPCTNFKYLTETKWECALFGDARHTEERQLAPLLTTALRVAFIHGSQIAPAHANLMYGVHHLRLDDVHLDGWHFRRGYTYAHHIKEFREQAAVRLIWLKLKDLTARKRLTPTAQQTTDLILNVCTELEGVARKEQSAPQAQTHKDAVMRLTTVLVEEGRASVPLISRAIAQLGMGEADQLAAARLRTLQCHHQPAERAPRPQPGLVLQQRDFDAGQSGPSVRMLLG